MFHFSRLFLAYTCETPFEFLRRIRVVQGIKLLQKTSLSCTEIGLSVGYGTPSAFNKVFKKLTKISPSQIRKIGKETQTKLLYGLEQSITQEKMMNLNLKYKIVDREKTSYLFFEGYGSFPETAPKVWDKLFTVLFPQINPIDAVEFLGLSLIDKTKKGEERMIYQAGICMKNIPKGLQNIQMKDIPAGQYASFELKGPYPQIWPAFNEFFKCLADNKVPLREEFCIENYLNDPQITPAEDLLTEILIPIA